MSDSASRGANFQIKEDGDHQQDTNRTQQRLCDFCGESTALLYCRADSAKLCFSCDRQVHSTNQLFTKHTRSLLCDACDSTPASILCSTESFVLCHNCDWERHNLSQSTLHERRPHEGFTGCPSVTELLSFVGFEDVSKKTLIGGGGGSCDDLVGSGGFGSEGLVDGCLGFWDTPPICSLDDLILSSSSGHNFQSMGVPPLPKNRNAACGQYKEEILRQLREMAILEPNFSDGEGDIQTLTQFQPLVPKQDLQSEDYYACSEQGRELATIAPYKVNAYQWGSANFEIANQGLPSKLTGSYIEENYLVPDKDSDVGGDTSNANLGHESQPHHCNVTEPVQVLPKVTPRELTSQERNSALSRYKEKKKTRRYDKHVRYESRKIRAESRTRIKGRFAKMDH